MKSIFKLGHEAAQSAGQRLAHYSAKTSAGKYAIRNISTAAIHGGGFHQVESEQKSHRPVSRMVSRTWRDVRAVSHLETGAKIAAVTAAGLFGTQVLDHMPTDSTFVPLALSAFTATLGITSLWPRPLKTARDAFVADATLRTWVTDPQYDDATYKRYFLEYYGYKGVWDLLQEYGYQGHWEICKAKLCEPLGRAICLGNLAEVPAYARFLAKLDGLELTKIFNALCREKQAHHSVFPDLAERQKIVAQVLFENFFKAPSEVISYHFIGIPFEKIMTDDKPHHLIKFSDSPANQISKLLSKEDAIRYEVQLAIKGAILNKSLQAKRFAAQFIQQQQNEDYALELLNKYYPEHTDFIDIFGRKDTNTLFHMANDPSTFDAAIDGLVQLATVPEERINLESRLSEEFEIACIAATALCIAGSPDSANAFTELITTQVHLLESMDPDGGDAERYDHGEYQLFRTAIEYFSAQATWPDAIKENLAGIYRLNMAPNNHQTAYLYTVAVTLLNAVAPHPDLIEDLAKRYMPQRGDNAEQVRFKISALINIRNYVESHPKSKERMLDYIFDDLLNYLIYPQAPLDPLTWVEELKYLSAMIRDHFATDQALCAYLVLSVTEFIRHLESIKRINRAEGNKIYGEILDAKL